MNIRRKMRFAAIGLSIAAACCFSGTSAWALSSTSTATLFAPSDDRNYEDDYGYAVAIDGNTAVVGVKDHDCSWAVGNCGAVFVYQKGTSGWEKIAKLIASDRDGGDLFGFSVAVDDSAGLIVVGAPNNTYERAWALDYYQAGAAYVFVRVNDNWPTTETKKLTASDVDYYDHFGLSVAVKGSVIAVGSPFDDDKGLDSGSVYFYTVGTWAQHKLTASTYDAADLNHFGSAVAVDASAYVGDYTAVIGSARGSIMEPFIPGNGWVFVYSRDAGTWTKQIKFSSDNPSDNDWFGYSVAISGATVIVGAPYASDNATNSGSAYVFTDSAYGWSRHKIVDPGGLLEIKAGDHFGWSVSVSGNNAIIGARDDDDLFSGLNVGSAYLYAARACAGGKWVQHAKLKNTTTDSTAGDGFGHSVAIYGNQFAIAGAPDFDGGGLSLNLGAAFVFSLAEGADYDSDGCTDNIDNCYQKENAGQEDGDADGVGNVCDNCPTVGNSLQIDSENPGAAGDGVGDACDNCMFVMNANQANMDGDALGDACDLDIDGDGLLNVMDECPNDTSNDRDMDNVCPSAGDCNDDSAAIKPGALETTCNGVDNDCDLVKDEDYIAPVTTCGAGACARTGLLQCLASGETQNTCVAGVPSLNDAICDSIDSDCDGQFDEDYVSISTTCGIGACLTTGYSSCIIGQEVNVCTTLPPAANDALCDGIDNDCDGQADEEFVTLPTTCGIGACASTGLMICQGGITASTCTPDLPSGEVCDSIDNDCDGLVDEGVQLTFYQDGDVDGYGNAAVSIQACTAPTGYVANAADCNDANAAINPAAVEVCDNVDNNCAGGIDEGVKLTFYHDSDADGFGNAAMTTLACTVSPGYVDDNTDCDDTRANVRPGGIEVCDGLDNNCNALTDEGFDSDGDMIANCFDTCPDDPQNDADVDSVCGNVDNCPMVANADQADVDVDGTGNVCDACDNRPITGSVLPSVDALWPPDHRMVPVTVNASALVTRNPDTQIVITTVGVAEYSGKASSATAGENIHDENNFEPDYVINGGLSLDLRSERAGASTGRTYTVTVRAADCSGSYDFSTQVEVPHDSR